MPERYTKIFSLPEQSIPAEISRPVQIVAGALLFDVQQNLKLAQVKYQNISNKSIRSLTVNIHTYDKAKVAIEGEKGFTYQDVVAGPQDFFGDKTPVFLPDGNAASFAVDIVSVKYSDGTGWSELGAQALQVAVVAGKSASRTAIDVGKLIGIAINCIITFFMGLAGVLAIMDFDPTPNGIYGTATIWAATIVSFPGIGRLIFKEKYSMKHRIIRWVIFALIIGLDLCIQWVVL